MNTDEIPRHSEDRVLNQARSKLDPVDRRARTAPTTVHHGIQYYSKETVLLIIPFLQTNIISQMCPSDFRDGHVKPTNVIKVRLY